MSLDLSPLEDAVSQLEEALEIYNSDIILRDSRFKRHLRAAVIQAFEFTYEPLSKCSDVISRWPRPILQKLMT